MINIKEKTKCCGCTACASICPKNCITMEPDAEGFLYPEVNEQLCVNCGLCEKVCPIRNHEAAEDEIETEAVVVRNKDTDVLENSSSGGFFSALCELIISEGGWCGGAVFNQNNEVTHYLTNRVDDIYRFRGSKYVQSNINGIFFRVKELLDAGETVCFSGTPCQIAGLESYLRKRYENLITVDIVCHGVPSPLLWDRYLKYLEDHYHAAFKKINFRSKMISYHSSVMSIEFNNGKTYWGSPRTDFMLKAFFSDICSRPSCYHCAFKGVERKSDLTIYDCWNPESLISELSDDDKGYTNVIVHSEKGKMLLQKLPQLQQYPVELSKMLPKTGGMVTNSRKPHPKREDFYSVVNQFGIEAAVCRFIPNKQIDFVIEKMKLVLGKMKVMYFLKKVRNKLHM